MKKLIICLGFMMLFGSLIVVGNGYAAEKLTKVVVGTTLGYEATFPYPLALKNGYFEQEGLDVETKTFIAGPPMMMSMANGELNLNVITGFPPMLQAAAQGVDIKILFSTSKGSAPVVAGPHIKTFKDLDDKIVGDPGLGTLQNTMLSLAAKKYGIKFKKLIHGKVTDLAVFLEKGEIDAFTSWEWFAADTVYRLKGVHYVLKWPVVENSECTGMGAYGKFYLENPEVVKKFMRGYLRGVKYFIENRKDMPAFLSKLVNEPEEVVKMAMEDYSVEYPDINIPSVKIMVEDGIDGGRIKKEAVPDVDAFLSKYIDQSFLKELKQGAGLK